MPMRLLGSYLFSLTWPQSMTCVTSSMVMQVSAMLVAKTTLRCLLLGGREKTKRCLCVGICPCRGSSHAHWSPTPGWFRSCVSARSISICPGKKIKIAPSSFTPLSPSGPCSPRKRTATRSASILKSNFSFATGEIRGLLKLPLRANSAPWFNLIHSCSSSSTSHMAADSAGAIARPLIAASTSLRNRTCTGWVRPGMCTEGTSLSICASLEK
mmetsp:Transcript_165595/g.531489  ORF Transcript_165595/g.531489 Transcript_165595/m.531489 type:complete len:213 (+) Transcript_165595:1864-2502(+)